LKNALKDPKDNTKLTLLFANLSSKDVLLKEKIDNLVKNNPNRFRVVYTIDKPEKDWKWETGFVTEELIKKYLPQPSPDSFIYVCGPPPQVAAVAGPKAKDYTQGELAGALKNLGYQKENVFKF